VDVHEHGIGLLLGELVERLGAVAGLARDGHAAIVGEHAGDALAHHGVVVDHHHVPGRGRGGRRPLLGDRRGLAAGLGLIPCPGWRFFVTGDRLRHAQFDGGALTRLRLHAHLATQGGYTLADTEQPEPAATGALVVRVRLKADPRIAHLKGEMVIVLINLEHRHVDPGVLAGVEQQLAHGLEQQRIEVVVETGVRMGTVHDHAHVVAPLGFLG